MLVVAAVLLIIVLVVVVLVVMVVYQVGLLMSSLFCLLSIRDQSIPKLDSTLQQESANIEKMKLIIEQQVAFEKSVQDRTEEERKKMPFPNPDTECSAPRSVMREVVVLLYALVSCSVIGHSLVDRYFKVH